MTLHNIQPRALPATCRLLNEPVPETTKLSVFSSLLTTRDSSDVDHEYRRLPVHTAL
jgi:hypothetical protein